MNVRFLLLRGSRITYGYRIMNVLVTGAAGFIGMHVVKKLLNRGYSVAGIDDINDYYSPALKRSRIAHLVQCGEFHFIEGSISDRAKLHSVFSSFHPDYVINLAGQAGVRYSLQNPFAYIDSNIVGFLNVLEECRLSKVRHLVYASSSSVYGANTTSPFAVSNSTDHPISLYAATKKSNELMAHSYSHLFEIPTTGLRYFTVYGPWGRPDMAPWLFTKAILDDLPIKVFNHGNMRRDFTYVEDIAEGTILVMEKVPEKDPNFLTDRPALGKSYAPFKVYNIGAHTPIELLDFIKMLEKELGRTAVLQMMEAQPGDVISTFADVSELKRDIGFEPMTRLDQGIKKWVDWFCSYHGIR